jgi:phospholipase/carboxylesterase
MHPYKIVEHGAPIHEASHALILLHGRGSSPEEMIALARRFVDKDWYIAAPEATNGSWYPYGFMEPRDRNEPWLGSAIGLVHQLIGEVNKRLPLDHIHLMGFSQGACLAMEVSARRPGHFGGIYAFTGGLIGDRIIPDSYQGSFNGTPVYLSNSDDDPHVPLSRSKETMAIFEKLQARVTLDVFPGRAHTIDPHEIDRVREMMAATA